MKSIWTVVIVILALVVLGYGSYRVYHHFTWKSTPTPAAMTQTTMKPKPTAMSQQISVYKMMNKNNVGKVVTDMKGMTLYTFAKDTSGESKCTGACLQNWPAYAVKQEAGMLPVNIGLVKRSDGSSQYAWKGMPLYYYIKDKDSGDAYGNGVGGVWSVVK